MLACGFAALAARLRARRRGGLRRGRSTRQSGSPRLPLRARLRRPDPLRPLARGAWRSARRARGGPSRLGLGLLAVAAAAKLTRLSSCRGARVRRPAARPAGRARVARRFVAVAAVIVVPFAVLSPDGLVESVTRQSGRALQIESLGAALLMVGHRLNLYEPGVVSTFGSQNLAGPLPDALARC